MLHPLALMDITGTHRMPARLTATMDLIGSMAACLSELDPGSTGSVEATGAVEGSAVEAVLVDVDLQAADLKDAEPELQAAAGLLRGAGLWPTDPLAVDFAAVAPAHSTVVADSTAVAEAMAAVGTGN
jgi:hypothetical protein